MSSSPRPAAANCEVLTARRSGEGTVSALKVANDSDFWNAAIIVMPKSAGSTRISCCHDREQHFQPLG